jgi:hypothetical protein
VGHGETERKNNGGLDPQNGIVRKEREKNKRGEQDHGLKDLEKGKRCPPAVESRIQIFGEAVPQIAEVVVHAAADEGDGVARVGAVLIQDAETGGPHFASQSDVLDEMASDRLVASDFFVGSAAKKEKLAVGGTEGCGTPSHPMGEVKKDKKMHKRDNQVFAPTFGFEVGPQRDEVGFFVDGQGDGLGKGDVGKAGISVDKDQKFPTGFLG